MPMCSMPSEFDNLEGLGSLEYFVWIDTEDMYIVRTYFDISEYLQKMMKMLTESIEMPVGLGLYAQVLDENVSDNMTIDIYNINTCEDFDIPEAE